MPDSMIFEARDGPAQCELCVAHPATLKFHILCDREGSQQHGICCLDCAHHLVDALAQIRPPLSEPTAQPSVSPQPSSI